ncbi:MAG: hypothetical protein E7504_04375 [Ruminococcus sp.]|nr:hypothetical protein [Ruminococcus sp.]
MARKTFAQVLKDAKVDIEREYDRLYQMFYKFKIPDSSSAAITLYEICEMGFISFPHRGTCLSLDDFNDFYGFHFEQKPSNFDVDYLVIFCEYSYNLAIYQQGNGIMPFLSPATQYIQQILKVIESIGYMHQSEDGISTFVPKSQPAIVVSEMLPPNLSYKVIEYNHHSMKGNLARKQATLKLLADQLESNRAPLKSLNKSLEDDLFYLLNNINIRHNNIDSSSTKYKRAVADMPKDELEEWYDRTYDICLYAFMTLAQADRNAKVKQLKNIIEDNKV